MIRLRRLSRGDRAMSCRDVAKVLQSLVDGELDGVPADEVSRHIEACRRCGMEASVYREIKASLARSAPEVEDSARRRLREFGDRVLAERPGTLFGDEG